MLRARVRMFSGRSVSLRALLIVALFNVPVAAQTGAGIIGGVLRDASGGAIPGATVRVVNEDTDADIEAVTNPEGSYQVAPLPPGHYRVEAMLDGFDTAVNRVALAAEQKATVDVTLNLARFSQSVVVTARRVEEVAQDVPIPVSVVKGDLVADAGAFNVNRLKEMIPTVQCYSTNPRNSSINIRGLGAPFGFTNDGLEAGVGMYIDGVFYARPASATTDFLDVERVEVLRGPQGTLFGKNTTAGALNITTTKPSFTRSSDVEVNYGNLQFVQAKASVTGPLFKKAAGRVSFSGTGREGTVLNVTTHDHVNTLNNLGVRGQLLVVPSESRDHLVDRRHPPASPGVHAGGGGRGADGAGGEPAVHADCGEPRIHAAEFQCLRPGHRRRQSTSLVSGPWRHGAQRGLDSGPRAADLDELMALLALESVERSRLPGCADHDDLSCPLDAAPVDAGSPVLRRGV
jgi:hypothetical protein